RGVAAKRKLVWPGGLSDREVEVARLVAIGRTNKEIGALLGMSPRTAQKHVMNVYEKLGLESRAGLALYAVERGLLDPDLQWVQSYVTSDRIYCVYNARDPEILREHARCGGFPADAVNEVCAI